MTLPAALPTPKPGLAAVPTLDELANDPGRAGSLPREAVATLLARCAAVQSVLTARLLSANLSGPSPAAPGPPEALTVPQVAALLKITPPQVYALARRGELPAFRVGKYVRVSVAALQARLADPQNVLYNAVSVAYTSTRDRQRAAGPPKAARSHPAGAGRAGRGALEHPGPPGTRRDRDRRAPGPAHPAPGARRVSETEAGDEP